MAKRKKGIRRAFARARAFRVGRRSARRSSGGSNPLMSIVLPAVAYGGVRQTLKGYAQPLSSMIPLGENSDEALMGVAGWFLMKNTSGFISDFGKAALYVESASLGHNIINPMLAGVTGSISSQASNQILY